MARARNIKPGFFKNADLVELTMEARLLFIGLWTMADRAGRLEDRPKQIKIEVFPADPVDIDARLDDLQRMGFVKRYEVAGRRLLQVVNFKKHQSPHKDEKPSELPEPDAVAEAAKHEHGASTVQAQCGGEGGTVVTALNEDSLIPDSRILSADSAAPAAAPAAPPSKAKRKAIKTAMPDGFGISERVKTWAAERSFGRLPEHLESFRSKCAAHGYTYADWDEGFMGAIRDDWAKLRSQPQQFTGGSGPPITVPSNAAARTAAEQAALALTPEQKAAADAKRREVMANRRTAA